MRARPLVLVAAVMILGAVAISLLLRGERIERSTTSSSTPNDATPASVPEDLIAPPEVPLAPPGELSEGDEVLPVGSTGGARKREDPGNPYPRRTGLLFYRVVDRISAVEVWEFDLGLRLWGESNCVPVLGRNRSGGWFAEDVPLGTIGLLVRADALGYCATIVEDVVITEDQETRVTIELERGLDLTLLLDFASGPWPEDHALFLVEDEVWDEIHYDQLSIDGGSLYPLASLLDRQARFDVYGITYFHGLTPRLHRFKVFPDDLVIEPAELELMRRPSESIEIRWRRKE